MKRRIANLMRRWAERLDPPKPEPPAVYYARRPGEQWAVPNLEIYRLQDGTLTKETSFDENGLRVGS